MLLAFDNRLYRPANANYVKIAFENSQISTEKTNKRHMNNFEKTEEFCSAKSAGTGKTFHHQF
jgi:hypothetical protein